MRGCGKGFTWHETDTTNACLYKDDISEESSDQLQEKNHYWNHTSELQAIEGTFCSSEAASFLAFLLILYVNLEIWLNIESNAYWVLIASYHDLADEWQCDQYLVSHFSSSRCWTIKFHLCCLFYPWAWTSHLRQDLIKVVRYLQKVPWGCKEMEIWGTGTLTLPRKHPSVPVDTQACPKQWHWAYLQLSRQLSVSTLQG